MNFKEEIAKILNVNENEILKAPKPEMGDYSFPCFNLAKENKCAPFVIANQIKDSLKENALIEKTEVVGGYLNFYLNKAEIAKVVLKEFESFKVPNIGNGKLVCIDYCSVNLAKYLHIGHFTTTIIGESLARIYETLGYKVVRINYVGDYGTPFGKMAVAYKLWGNEQDLLARGVDAVQDLYVKFCANENEELLDKAREASKNIENKCGDDYKIYTRIIDITIEETKRLIGRMNISFDDWRGESTYNDKMDKPLEEIKNAGLSKVENGATIIDMNEYGLGVCVLVRSDGASLYITRDIAAAEDRYQMYNFDEMLYVTACQQNSHFAKLIKISELLNKPYKDKLKHISYGMFSLPEGKIASRKGKQALFQDILNEAEARALDAVKDRNITEDKKQEIAKKVAMGAIAFSVLKVERIKDKVFDLEKAVSFDGETGPYLQYTYARTCSLIKKFQEKFGDIKADSSIIPDTTSFEIIKILAEFDNLIIETKNKAEPCLLARELLNLAGLFNKYYNENKIITDDANESASKIAFVINVSKALEIGMQLVCIDPTKEM